MCVYTPNLNTQQERTVIEGFVQENDILYYEIPISLTCASIYSQIEHSGICMDSQCIELIQQYVSQDILRLVAKAMGRDAVAQKDLTEKQVNIWE